MKYLLDTNICIYAIKRSSTPVLKHLHKRKPGDVGISSITVAELRYGADKNQAAKNNHNALNRFLASLQIIDFDYLAVGVYGSIRAQLESKGTPIGPLDTLIAAHALSVGATVATSNVREFRRVPGLQVEDWTK